NLSAVFNAILQNATRLCSAMDGGLFKYENGEIEPVALHNVPEALAEHLHSRGKIKPRPGSTMERIVTSKNVLHLEDILKDPDGATNPASKYGGARTFLGVPMLKNREVIGAIIIFRQEVRPFTDRQIELVKNFAAQAVIAIENTRLLNELRQRTDDLSESLEQQTATSEVLQAISSSPGQLGPVFEAMLENAVRICRASFGTLLLYEGDRLRRVARMAAQNVPQSYASDQQTPPHFIAPFDGAPSLGRLVETKALVHIADIATEHPDDLIYKVAAARTVLIVPMLKESDLVGAFAVYRKEVQEFSAKQVELLENFAAQAVIAIENTRLLNELRQRTGDLSEALEQQTATSEVLKIIASSPGNLEPVFSKMLGSATRICEAKFGTLFLYDGNTFRVAAGVGTPPELAEFERLRGPFRPELGSRLERIVGTKQVIHIVDDAAEGVPSPPTRLAGARSIVAVPMVKDDVLIGAITIYRQEVRPFTDKQIALLINFAAQAVIAIENTRLLNDLNKLNQQLEQRVTDQVSEIERMGKLRRFLPPQVADLIVASGTEKQLESHRREITALFCDLRGFTGFSESSDPEDVMALLHEYHAAIGAIINKYGGTLERYAGDGVMVVFNDPIPVDNPALQAVLMAIDMKAAIGGLIEKWRKLGHDIGFGIGIAHGFATLGTIGFEGRFDYAAIGMVSNVASRLCDE
ncbi:MAG TPA: GAF domain-containing protein, partial [Anaerolineae bacterium]|nr:GAF domain-containing protein [Anaerolineae bacterium]